MNKILVNTNPTAPFQRIIVIQNDIIIDQIGAQLEDLSDLISAFAEKHNIEEVNFLGPREYSLGLMKTIQNNLQFAKNLKFKYYGG